MAKATSHACARMVLDRKGRPVAAVVKQERIMDIMAETRRWTGIVFVHT